MLFVRSATEKDLPSVSRLLGEAWHATYDQWIGADKVAEITRDWHSVPALKARLHAPSSEFVVADSGKMIGGMAYASMEPTLKATAVLRQLYVLPQFQRQGIGRDLFAEVETCFPDARMMRLEVEPRNVDAIRFYRRLGFEVVGEGETPPAALGLLAHVIMEKRLDF